MSDAIIVRAGNVTKGYVDKNLELRVDKIEGKGLSTNDYDNAAKEAVESLGTASKCDTGTSEGNVPVINSNGKLDTSIIPQIAITDTYSVDSEEEMLALTAQKGDVAIRSDESKSYILKTAPASVKENWLELQSPDCKIFSVNGQTGAVVLTTDDIEEKGNLYYTDERVKAVYEEKLGETSSKDLTDGETILHATDTIILNGGNA